MFARSRKYPFADGEDPVAHMVSLLSLEAERAGTPFTDEEKELLGKDAPEHPLLEELRQKFSARAGDVEGAEPRWNAAPTHRLLAIRRDPQTGVYFGASESRKDGQAAGY